MEGSHPDTGTAFYMRILITPANGWVRRLIASGLVVLFTVPIALAQPVQPTRPPAAGPSIEAPTDSTSPATPQAVVKNQESSSLPPSAPEPQQKATPKEPVGTAAAPLEKATGIAASRPAGAAIAPAKQRRARSILIKLGFILGAAVAIGTVVALSKGSPSTPN